MCLRSEVKAALRSRSSLHRQRPGAAHVEATDVFVPEVEDVVRGGDRGEVERRFVRQEEAAVGEVLVAGVKEGEEARAREETVPHPVAQNKVHLVKGKETLTKSRRVKILGKSLGKFRDLRSKWAPSAILDCENEAISGP